MSIKDKEKKCGGLHIKIRKDDIIYLEYNGEKLQIHYHGQNEDNEASLSFVGSKNFLVARSKLLKKLGLL